MKYNFDEIIERKNTNSIKYDFAKRMGKPEDAIPLWVADMDFRTPLEVSEALVESAKHGIFGYSESQQQYYLALEKWFAENFGWNIQPSWLVKTPGVVFAIAMAIRALTKEGDGVLIQRPVYYPFEQTILANERNIVNNPLIYENLSYQIDFEDFESKIVYNNVRLFILCNPHNPVGRVWTHNELVKLGDICIKHGVIVVSDEIHADFVYNGYRHLIFADLKPEFSDIAITCTAPSKTFNLAGLQVSNIFIGSSEIRSKFMAEFIKTGYFQINTMGLVACQAAYQFGKEWLDELKIYLGKNLEFIRDFLSERLPQIKLIEPQGTYLIWLDFNALDLTDDELENLITSKAKLWLDRGSMFGEEGKGFQRINIACPRKILEKAFIQLEKAVNNLQ